MIRKMIKLHSQTNHDIHSGAYYAMQNRKIENGLHQREACNCAGLGFDGNI
jgi:plastocyanin domain-containing protein